MFFKTLRWNLSGWLALLIMIGEPVKVTDLAPLTADWTITYEFPGVPPAEIKGRYQW